MKSLSLDDQRLKVSGNEELHLLSNLPADANLKTLIIENCDLEALVQLLPQSLESLHLSNCTNLKSITDLSHTKLTNIYIKDCPEIAEIGSLPPTLNLIDFSNSQHQLRSWPVFENIPNNTKFHLANCHPDITNLALIEQILNLVKTRKAILSNTAARPSNNPMLTKANSDVVLNFVGDPMDIPEDLWRFNQLKIIVNSDQNIDFNNPELIKKFSLFQQLRKIVRAIPNLTALPEDKALTIKNSSFTVFPALPFWKTLTIQDCGNFQSLENNDELERITVKNCDNFRTIPQNLSPKLTEINIENCPNFQFNPDHLLPITLTKLVLSNVDNIQSLPLPLPPELTHINIRNTTINVDNALQTALWYLENRGATVIYPVNNQAHVEEEIHDEVPRWIRPSTLRMLQMEIKNPKSTVKQKFASIINKFNEANKNKPAQTCPKLDFLLDRLLSEQLNSRGGLNVVIKQTILPILEELEKHHNILPLLEDLTPSDHDDHCINQPVQIWSELSAWIHVEAQNNIADKIDAAKFAMTIERMKCFMNPEKYDNKSDPTQAGSMQRRINGLRPTEKPGQLVEVEFANVLLREIHKKFLTGEVIKKPWPGISNAICHEAAITSILTQDVIDRAYKYITEEISDPKKLQNFLLETNASDIWQNLVLSKSELDNIGRHYRKLNNVCLLALRGEEPDEEEKLLLTQPGNKEYYEDLKSRQLSPEGYEAELKQLKNAEKTTIMEMVKKKMMQTELHPAAPQTKKEATNSFSRASRLLGLSSKSANIVEL